MPLEVNKMAQSVKATGGKPDDVFNPLTHMKERENYLFKCALKFTTVVLLTPPKNCKM